MKDMLSSDFASLLSAHLASKPTTAVAEVDSEISSIQCELDRHLIDIPFAFEGLDLRLTNHSALSQRTLMSFEKMVSLDIKIGAHTGRVSLFAATLSSLAERANAQFEDALLQGPSGHLVIEHLFMTLLEQAESDLRIPIMIMGISWGGEPEDFRPGLRLAMLCDAMDTLDTVLNISGPDEIISTVSRAFLALAPELAPEKPIKRFLTVSLRSPVFAIDDATADLLSPGDMLLLDERFTGLDCCRIWVDDKFSAAVKPERIGIKMMTEPTANTDALEGTHWFNTGVTGAAQIVIGEKQVHSTKIANWMPEIAVPISYHDLTQVVLKIDGYPPIDGRLQSLPGQWAFVVRAPDCDG